MSARHRGGDSTKLVTKGIRGKSASEKLTAVLFRLLIIFWCFTEQLVVKAVSLAIARDGASGGVVRTVIVRCVLSISM